TSLSSTRGATLASDPYYSRSTSEWEAAPREDPVVWGSTPEPLDRETLARYEQQGFLTFPELLSPAEAASLLDHAQQLAHEADPAAPDVIVEPESHAVRSLFRLHQTSEVFSRLAADPRIVGMVRQLLGGDVYVHQSRVNFKPAFRGKEFFWHSDLETWHIEDGMPRMRAVSVSINLSASHEFNGPLMLVPGS